MVDIFSPRKRTEIMKNIRSKDTANFGGIKSKEMLLVTSEIIKNYENSFAFNGSIKEVMKI